MKKNLIIDLICFIIVLVFYLNSYNKPEGYLFTYFMGIFAEKIYNDIEKIYTWRKHR